MNYYLCQEATIRVPKHEREIPRAIYETDIDEFVSTYSRPDGWRRLMGLYRENVISNKKIVIHANS